LEEEITRDLKDWRLQKGATCTAAIAVVGKQYSGKFLVGLLVKGYRGFGGSFDEKIVKSRRNHSFANALGA
jgi:hypothetical protein